MSFGYRILGFGSGGGPNLFMVASGGDAITEANIGGTDYKIHKFTGNGDFVVEELGADVSVGDKIQYLVNAGGAGGGSTGSSPLLLASASASFVALNVLISFLFLRPTVP